MVPKSKVLLNSHSPLLHDHISCHLLFPLMSLAFLKLAVPQIPLTAYPGLKPDKEDQQPCLPQSYVKSCG